MKLVRDIKHYILWNNLMLELRGQDSWEGVCPWHTLLLSCGCLHLSLKHLTVPADGISCRSLTCTHWRFSFLVHWSTRLPRWGNSEETDEACPVSWSVPRESWSEGLLSKDVYRTESLKKPTQTFTSSWQPVLGNVSACFPGSYVTWIWH